jgi:hypothetical protein
MPDRIYNFSDDESWPMVEDGIADVRTSPPTITPVDACTDDLRFVSPDGIIVKCAGEASVDTPRPILVHRATQQVVDLEGGRVVGDVTATE